MDKAICLSSCKNSFDSVNSSEFQFFDWIHNIQLKRKSKFRRCECSNFDFAESKFLDVIY
jgi:hypothetical protein